MHSQGISQFLLPSTASRVACISPPSPFVDVIPHIGSLSTTFQIQTCTPHVHPLMEWTVPAFCKMSVSVTHSAGLCGGRPTPAIQKSTKYDDKSRQTDIYTVSRKKERLKRFFVISHIKLGRFWWNLVHCFLNKFASKWCQRFPLHLNNVSTLPCETWNAYCAHATIELLPKNSRVYVTSTVFSKFAWYEFRW